MNKLLILFCLLAVAIISKAQTKAITDTGREVLLFNDGTWKYANDSTENAFNEADTLFVNKTSFNKSTSSTFLVKSTTIKAGVYINPSKWAFSPRRDNEKNPEYTFGLKSGEGYAMMLTEKTQISLETMRQVALLNASRAAADIKETNAEYRIVNKRKVLCLQFQGTIKGIKVAYMGYYYSSTSGTVQLFSYSGQPFFQSVQKELELLLNGLVELEN